MAANFTDKEVECPLLKEWGVPADEDGAAKSRDNGVKLLIHNYNDLPSRPEAETLRSDDMGESRDRN